MERIESVDVTDFWDCAGKPCDVISHHRHRRRENVREAQRVPPLVRNDSLYLDRLQPPRVQLRGCRRGAP
jgi:hypothetical protein